MLVKLSSDNQLDPTKFSNTFSESLTIKPFSKICLIKGQITKFDTGKKIKIDAGTVLNIRFTPYDVVQIILNPGADTVYTLPEFISTVRGLLPDGTALNRGGSFVDVTGTEVAAADLEWVFYWTGLSPDYETFMYNNAEYRRLFLAAFTGKAMPKTGPSNLGAGFNQTQIGGGTGNYACGTAWDITKYTPPPNQVNGFAHNMLLEDKGDATTNWVLAQPNIRNLHVTFGNGTHNGTAYTDAPIIGTDRYQQPGGTWGNALLDIHYRTNGLYLVKYFNVAQNNFETVVTDLPYQPGDTWELSALGISGNTGQRDFKRYFSFNAELKRSNGLQYWIPGRTNVTAGNTVMVLNDTINFSNNPYALTLEQYYTDYLDLELDAQKTRYFEKNMDTTWLGTGPRFVAGNNTDNSGETRANSAETAIDGGILIAKAGITDVVKGLVGSSLAWTDRSFFLERYTTAAVPALASDKNAVMLVDRGTGIPLTTPYMTNFFIRPADDTAQLAGGGTNRMTILSSHATEARLVEIAIGQQEAWDIQFYSAAGGATSQTLQLQDASTNRINIALGTNYHFTMLFYGSNVGTGKGQISFEMVDLDTGIKYTGSDNLVEFMNPILALGGIEPNVVTDYNQASCAYYADFRHYQKCETGTGTAAMFTPQLTAVQNYWKTGVYDDVQFFWGGTKSTVFPTAQMLDGQGNIQESYIVGGLGRPEVPISQFFQRDLLENPVDSGWYDVQNVYSPGCTHVPNAKRITTLPATSYANSECGLCQVGSIQDEFEFINPQVDEDGNVLENRTNVYTGDGVNNPDADFKIDLEDRQLDRDTVNIEVTNLTHRTFNGTNGSIDKTIYQMPLKPQGDVLDNLEIIEDFPNQKVWLDLNNPSEIPLTRLDVQLSDTTGRKLSNIVYTQPTNIVIEIRNDKDFN